MSRYVPVPESQRKRPSRKYRLYHDQCTWLDVVALAKAGWFAPGIHRGWAETFCDEFADWNVRVEIATAMRQSDGVLRLDVPGDELMPGMLTTYWPREMEIELVRLDSLPNRPRWYFVCPDPECSRRVRRLYLPESPPGITPHWRCRHCWRLLYRDWRPQYIHADTVRRVERLDALAADIATLRRIALKRLDEPL
jgi:hypothetical protein